MVSSEARLYFETARHLRVRQMLGWASELVPRQAIARTALPLRARAGEWVEGYLRPASMLPGGEVWILNQGGVLEDWNSPERPRLWNYHLHYFEDPRVEPEWLERWMAENPVGHGAGWEPYPLSRRIVNWIRWAARGRHVAGQVVEGFDESLAAQARALYGKIEYRLLANHLFVNAKALIYAGTYFAGPEAERWLRTGLEILDREVGEQVLADGGHYERSPMYHALILEDLLDLESLRLAYPGVWAERAAWREASERMLGWLGEMTQPDGEIAFFQDACFGVAGTYSELAGYGERLGYGARRVSLGVSGYRRLAVGEFVVLFDGGGVAPEYQPGHAHAGALSFELSYRGERVVVNSGISTYEAGVVRAFERSTEAHATVRVDGRDSSELWGAFRVARRARVAGLDAGAVCWGYAGGQVRRRLSLSGSELRIQDEVSGGKQAEWFFPLHPAIEVRGLELWRAGWRIGHVVAPMGVQVQVERAEWRPEFYRRVPASRIRFTGGMGFHETRLVFEGHV